MVALIIIVWRALGYPLSFAKAQRGKTATWIMASYKLGVRCVTVTIKEAIITDVLMILAKVRGKNLMPVKDLHSLAGKLNSISSLIFTLRPFLKQIWGALAAVGSKPTKAPDGMVWVVQFKHALTWAQAFLEGKTGSITREFRLGAYLRMGSQIDGDAPAAKPGGGSCRQCGGLFGENCAPHGLHGRTHRHYRRLP